ncbi:phage tail terminator protein [Aliihoeflea sp. PC F10.4]
MSIDRFFQDQINGISPAVFRMVGSAADFSLISDAPKAFPAAYVLIEEEASSANERATGGPVMQICEVDVAVVIVTKAIADTTGAAAAVQIGALKSAVRKALIGKVIDADTGIPIEHVSGELLRARSGWVWHREVFSTAIIIEEVE